MAEENHKSIYDELSHDDMSVMNSLLHTVKGISFTSMVPDIDDAMNDDGPSLVSYSIE